MAGKPAARKGDKCTGHGDAKPRACDQGSPDVFINGKPAHRKGDHWKRHKSHDSVLAQGSSTVFVNGKQQGRKGDPVRCGSKVAQGSPDVFVGDSGSSSNSSDGATSQDLTQIGGSGRFAGGAGADSGYSGAGTISDESGINDDGQDFVPGEIPNINATDVDWLTTCMMDEALSQQSSDAWAGVAQVVINRLVMRYTGNPVNPDWQWTIKGIVLARNAFSGFYFEMVNGRYTRVASSYASAEKRGLQKIQKYQSYSQWAKFKAVAQRVASGTYQGGSSWNLIRSNNCTLYYNPRISSPAWARTTTRVTQIEAHAFHRE